MIVGTSEAANLGARSLGEETSPGSHRILNISTPRLRVLLIEGRVEGAYKTGKIWLIPSLGARSLGRETRPGDLTVVASRTHRLFQGKPIIQRGKRGPAPRWRNPRKPAKTIIHVNTHKIKQNQKHQQKEPVITVKRGNTNQYGHEVEIPGGCRVVYRPKNPICGGARVWIESLYEVNVISLQF